MRRKKSAEKKRTTQHTPKYIKIGESIWGNSVFATQYVRMNAYTSDGSLAHVLSVCVCVFSVCVFCCCRYLNNVSSFWCISLFEHPYKWHSRGVYTVENVRLKRNIHTIFHCYIYDTKRSNQFALNECRRWQTEYIIYASFKVYLLTSVCMIFKYFGDDQKYARCAMHWSECVFMHLIATTLRIQRWLVQASKLSWLSEYLLSSDNCSNFQLCILHCCKTIPFGI